MNDSFAEDQVRAVELGRHVHGEVELAHRVEGLVRVRHRHGEIAAERHQRLRAALTDGDHGGHGVMAVFDRWLEPIRLADAFVQSVVGFFGDAHRAIALDVAVSAQRADTGAPAADVAAQEHQVGDLLHVLHAVHVLRDTHAVADDHVLRFRVDVGRVFDLRPGEA